MAYHSNVRWGNVLELEQRSPAMKEGFQAWCIIEAFAGRNPHKLGSVEHADWQHGFDNARDLFVWERGHG